MTLCISQTWLVKCVNYLTNVLTGNRTKANQKPITQDSANKIQ